MNRKLTLDIISMTIFMVALSIAHWQLVSGTEGFGLLYFLGFFPLHVLNFWTSGFNAGEQVFLWWEGRKFRKMILQSINER